MSAALLLAGLRERGITVSVSGLSLRVRPARLLTDADNQAIRANKAELVRLASFEALLFDAASLREWIPTLAWSDVPPGATVPLWCEEWEQPDYSSWAHAPCLKLEAESAPEGAMTPLALPDGWVQKGAFIVAIDGETKRGGAA